MPATTAQLDYSGDWRYWDNTESVSIVLNLPGGTTTTVTISDAFRGDIDRKAATYLGIEISEVDQIWTIPTELLGTDNSLKPADTITDGSGVVWTVETAQRVMLGTSELFWSVATSRVRN